MSYPPFTSSQCTMSWRYTQYLRDGLSHLRDDVLFISYNVREEANGQFIAHRCGKCDSTGEKCPFPSVIFHPLAIFVVSDTHDAPAQNIDNGMPVPLLDNNMPLDNDMP